MKTNVFILTLFLFSLFSGSVFSQVIINDEYFPNQWYLNMTGNDNTRADIRILDAWSRTMGNSNQKIADIEDSGGGIPGHDDLLGRVNTQGGGIIGQHATNIAGIIVANHNTIGIAGINKYAQLNSYVFTGFDQWADKIRDARLDGNQIINISQGAPPDQSMPQVAAQLIEAHNSNIVTAVSVGNSGSAITKPATFAGVIAVGSSTKYNTRPTWSNYGPQIKFLAPGGSTLNDPTNVDNLFTTSSSGSYIYASGTSMAAPVVSGAASLLLDYKPDLTNEDVKNILKYSCDKLEEMGTNDFTVTCGYGRINLKKAMQFLEPPYSIYHGNATLTKLEDNKSMIFSGNPVLAPGIYLADWYRLSVNRDDLDYLETPMAWLPIGYSPNNPNNSQEYMYVSTTSTSVNANTFFYYVRYDEAGNPINIWLPYNPSGSYYTVLGKSAVINVPQDYPTIEAALAGVISGQTIQVNGVVNLSGNINIPSGVELKVNSGATLTIASNLTLTFASTAKFNIYGTLTASDVTFDFTAKNGSIQNGIKLHPGSYFNSSNVIVKNAWYGVYRNGGVSNVEVFNCEYGIYIYGTFGSYDNVANTKLYNNSVGLALLNFNNGTEEVYNNEIYSNNQGILFSNSKPQVKNNTIRNNSSYGVNIYNYSYPVLGQQVPNSGYNNIYSNGIYNVYNQVSGIIYAQQDWWGSVPPPSGKFYSTSGTIIYSPYLYGPYGQQSSPAINNTTVSLNKSANSLSDLILKAYSLIKENSLVDAREILTGIIVDYPDSLASYNALYLLRETYSTEEKTDLKDYYAGIFGNKVKKELHAMAGLILADIDKENKLKRLDDVIKNYKGEAIIELALFNKFLYYFNDMQDKESAKKVLAELDNNFPNSTGTIEAHRMIGDKVPINQGIAKKDIQQTETPTGFALLGNYPNPFNPTTAIRYALPKESDVELRIYDMLGKEIKSFIINSQSAGYQNIIWNGTNNNNEQVSSGVYIYRFKARSLEDGKVFEKSAKLLMMK